MEVHSESFRMDNTSTPGITNINCWRHEDSGYHTSFTPGSFGSSAVYNESLENSITPKDIRISGQITVDCYNITPLGRKFSCTTVNRPSTIESPVQRRGLKRRHNEETDSDGFSSSVPTPTSIIAGGIQRLQVHDENKNDRNLTITSVKSDILNSNSLYYFNEYAHTSYPTTPVKKICRTNCKLSPAKRSSKKINFAIHSLSCESHGLQVSNKLRPQSRVARTIQFRPDQKIDIIKMLYDKTCVWPALTKIFSYLSNDDIHNFAQVSNTWLNVWQLISNVRTKKQEYMQYLKNSQENRENFYTLATPKCLETAQNRSLKEIHNVLNAENVEEQHISPPGTPRTVKFKRFMKCASLDSRIQLSCVRCCQPAKVTEEENGEEWVDCTSVSCSYQFCRYCKCRRHPGKACFQYDLEGPSPSKRKKTSSVGTKKSKRNLRRLL